MKYRQRENHEARQGITTKHLAALLTIGKKQTQCPLIDECIKKMRCKICMYIHTMKYFSATKKNKILPLAATWVDLEIIILSEAKSEREGQTIYDVTGMWNLKYDRNELTYE